MKSGTRGFIQLEYRTLSASTTIEVRKPFGHGGLFDGQTLAATRLGRIDARGRLRVRLIGQHQSLTVTATRHDIGEHL